jgi:metal-responsive CopG/Arc/MetJ family transcriptional regulator
MRRALVSLPDGVWKVIDGQLKGKIGDGDSEVIRNIVIAYLTERGYLLEPKGSCTSTDQIATELDIHDNMISSLAELLEEKGQIRLDEWDARVKRKIQAKRRLTPK